MRYIAFTLRLIEKSKVLLGAVQNGAVMHEASNVGEHVDGSMPGGSVLDRTGIKDVENSRFDTVLPLEFGEPRRVDVGRQHGRAFSRHHEGGSHGLSLARPP